MTEPEETAPLTTVVIPTVGRPSLRALLEALADGTEKITDPILVVDDRPLRDASPHHGLAEELEDVKLPNVRVLRSGGGGPARARNLGWRHARTEWVSFLDDDVLPDPDWYAALRRDLSGQAEDVAGSAGQVRVPLPEGRRPTDWERSTAGLATAQWITADLSYRRAALAQVGGFDERFPRAFREDADLGLRVSTSSGRIVTGERWITHPVRRESRWASLRQQRGNADDFLMRALHGPDWRTLVGAPQGRRRRHAAVAAAGVTAALAAGTRHPRATAVAGALWLAGTAEFAWARIAPGPRDREEVLRMLATSAAIPFAASWHSVRGAWLHRRAAPWRGVPDLVLVDRDDTVVRDVPYNGDPELVEPVPGAREALDRLRGEGIRVGLVSNQSGIGTGRLTREQVEAVNARVEELLGPFDVVKICPHSPTEGCTCRKPAPGMVLCACDDLGVDPARCVVVGDIGSDVEAAVAAGAHGVLVPTERTRAAEVGAARHVVRSITEAVDDALSGAW